LTTFISVETETNGVVEGEIKLPVPSLEIKKPPGVKGLSPWIAATELTADESWEGISKDYQVGDAITRIRRFTIKGAPAMVIPASPDVKLDGIHVYNAPALVEDKAVGGSFEGVREERVVFTIKSGGERTLPGHQIHWFNPTSQKIEKIEFPSRRIDVPGGAPSASSTTAESSDETKNFAIWALAVLGVVFGFWLLRWIGRRTWFKTFCKQFNIWKAHQRTKKDFMKAASQQDSRQCL